MTVEVEFGDTDRLQPALRDSRISRTGLRFLLVVPLLLPDPPAPPSLDFDRIESMYFEAYEWMSEALEAIRFREDLELETEPASSSIELRRKLEDPVELVSEMTGLRSEDAELEEVTVAGLADVEASEVDKFDGEDDEEDNELNRPLKEALPDSLVRPVLPGFLWLSSLLCPRVRDMVMINFSSIVDHF